MYWELVINNRHDGDSLLSGNSKLKTAMELEFDDGVKIDDNNISLIDFKINESKEESIIGNITDYISIIDLGGIVLSEESKVFFDFLGVKNIQYIEVRLDGANNRYHKKKYFIANIIGVINCIDYDESDLDIEDEYIDDIYSLMLIEDKIPEDIEIFRLKESVLTIIISDKLKSSIEKSNLTGFIFRNLKDQEIIPLLKT